MSGVVPLCSAQYRQSFNTTRIPGKEHGKHKIYEQASTEVHPL